MEVCVGQDFQTIRKLVAESVKPVYKILELGGGRCRMDDTGELVAVTDNSLLQKLGSEGEDVVLIDSVLLPGQPNQGAGHKRVIVRFRRFPEFVRVAEYQLKRRLTA